MSPATARQLEYAAALGIQIPASCDKDSISKLIDAAVQSLDDPPNSGQLRLARSFNIHVPPTVKVSRDLVDLLYEHLKARRWVYSVIRHVVKAKWKRYSESGLPEQYANEIASAFKKDRKRMANIEERDGGNHASGGDVWYRITAKSANSAEYLFVKNYDLPDDVLASINVRHLTQGDQPRRRGQSKAGCLSVVICGFFAIVIAAALSQYR
jgi:hypothetical protein